MHSSRLVVALLMMAATEARADDLKLTELGITVSVPPEGGFSHQVISGLDVILATAPYDGVVMSFGLARNQHGEPCAFAVGVDSPPQPIDLPPGWQHGAHFVKD